MFFGRISPHDLGHGEKYLKSVYDDRMLTPVQGLKIIKTLQKIESILHQQTKITFNYPTLILLGEKDVICPMKETHKLLVKIQFKDLSVH